MESSTRRDELALNLASVQSRIDSAAKHVGRTGSDITLIVVTKTWPASDVALLEGLGVTDVGENRDQEAAPKHTEVQRLSPQSPLHWHFVGQLQSNKANSVARYADFVHSVDRHRLVSTLDRAAGNCERSVTALVQVSLDTAVADAGRGGVREQQSLELADAIATSDHLRLGGVMGVAPLGEDPEPAFARLRSVAEAVTGNHPDAKIISAGMSGDLEAAVAQGATHVRVGSAVLGARPPVG